MAEGVLRSVLHPAHQQSNRLDDYYTAGNNSPIRTAMIAITTRPGGRSSTKRPVFSTIVPAPSSPASAHEKWIELVRKSPLAASTFQATFPTNRSPLAAVNTTTPLPTSVPSF